MLKKGIIYKSTGIWHLVKSGNIFYKCRIKGKLRLHNSKSTSPVVVGDRVSFILDIENNSQGIITEVQKRRNHIIRKSVKLSKQFQVIASNIDQIYLIITLNYPITFTQFIDRILVTAEAYRIPLNLVFNKMDIYSSSEKIEIKKLKKIYELIGYKCYKISALNKDSVNKVSKSMKNKVNMIIGHSGVGKSTLINTISPNLMIKTSDTTSIKEIRRSLNVLDLGDTVVTKISDPADTLIGSPKQMFLIKIEQQGNDEEVQNNMIIGVKETLKKDIGEISFLQTESVGSKISDELIKKAVLAVCLAVFAVLFYIWIRFEWQFSLGAVLALIHDVIITIGIFSIIGLEFNLSIIAALLTIVGYSLNDTVIVFDRIRENLKKYQSVKLIDVLNKSINETLSRTIITSLTTLLALLALFIFGGEVIRGFTFAMIWGVLIGTYSSIFIASSILLKLGVKRDWNNKNTGNPGTNYSNFDN